MSSTTTTPSHPLIACTESYLCPSQPIGTFSSTGPATPALHLIDTPTLTKLKNVGPARVKDMRTLGQSKQIISHIPVAANLATCAKFNDALFAAIQMNTEKFSALALLPCSAGEGKDAAKELQRCITKMQFVGGMLGFSGRNGLALYDASFEELWDMSEKYRVPIALRELFPVGSDLPTYQAHLSTTVLAPLATHIHTSHAHSPLTLIHLYLSGAFDRHPNLRILLSSPGLLPWLIPRIETILSHVPAPEKPKRSYLDVWQHNFYITTADALDLSTLKTLLEQVPIDRVLYASNYPLEERGKELMEELKESGFLTGEEWERVARGNAETLFRLRCEVSGVKK